MDIVLEAVLPNGYREVVGSFVADSPPRQGEIVCLHLHRGYVSRDETEYKSAQHIVNFLVKGVTYVAHNTEITEDWMVGVVHSRNVSNYAVIDVVATNDEARDYLARLADQREYP
jgi:hypothetical protein